MDKYPKRGDDCEYTEDCMWGVDGWCDRPQGMKCAAEAMDAKQEPTEAGSPSAKVEQATACWLAEHEIETELRGDELVAWIPPEQLGDFYELVHGGGDPSGIPGQITSGGDFYVNLTELGI